MMDTTRNDPFAGMSGLDDLADFKPKAAPKPAAAAIRAASEAANFPSRASAPKSAAPATTDAPVDRAQRRHRTGRNRQLNIKMTEATASRMAALADVYGCVYGELIDKALDALEKEQATNRVATS